MHVFSFTRIVVVPIMPWSWADTELGFRIPARCLSSTSCRWAAATICPRPGLQRKHAAAALSLAGRAGPDQPII